MKDHVSGVVVESEVVFGEGGLAGVEGGLVAESVGAVSEGGRHVDDGAGERYVSQESGRGRAQGELRESSELGNKERRAQIYWEIYLHLNDKRGA